MPFSDYYNLVYTQTDGTGAPLGKTHLGRTPCLDPEESTYWTNSADTLYPLEKIDEDKNKCTIDIPGFNPDDTRYLKLKNYEISEYELQKSSGVLSTL